MSKKLIIAKIFMGIICTLLILSTLTFGIIYGILIGGWSPGGAQPFETKYYNVPNIVGDYGVYISENFYVENNYSIPTKAEVYISNKHKVNRYQKDGYGADIVGRGEKLGYEVSTARIVADGFDEYLTIVCRADGFVKIKNKRKHNGFTYGTELKQSISEENENIMLTEYIYTVNFKPKQNSMRKCQIRLYVEISHGKDISSSAYAEDCDSLFYSLLDNVVYRNI